MPDGGLVSTKGTRRAFARAKESNAEAHDFEQNKKGRPQLVRPIIHEKTT